MEPQKLPCPIGNHLPNCVKRGGPCYSSFQGLKELANFTNNHWEISIQHGDTWYLALEKIEMLLMGSYGFLK
jgi:hypothetical protein